jgi:hypothetical protein
MKRLGIITALSMLLLALSASVAFAAVAPGTYGPNAGSFNSANAPASSHLTSGSPSCTVNADRSIDCSAYVLGGVGHTNATVLLSANYSAIIDCRNHGGSVVESHATTFAATNAATLTPSRNGRLRVGARSVSPDLDLAEPCPNPNWTPEFHPGTLTLNSFTYTLTFAGFTGAYITITGP